MSPAQEFLEHEEDENPRYHIERNGQVRTEFTKGFWKKMDESVSEQSTHREAHQKRSQSCKPILIQGERENPNQRDQADQEDADYGIDPSDHRQSCSDVLSELLTFNLNVINGRDNGRIRCFMRANNQCFVDRYDASGTAQDPENNGFLRSI